MGAPSPEVVLQVSTVIVALGYVSIAVTTICAALLLLPSSLVAKLPKLVKRGRSRLVSTIRRARQLSAEGPFYRLAVWCGRKIGRGRCASRCQAPDLRAKPVTCGDLQASIGPRLPWNPLHEETYVVQWSRADAQEPRWREFSFHPDRDCEKSGGRLKAQLEGLPDASLLRLRACAENVWGRGPWSKEIQTQLLCRPNEDGGFHGPLGAACDKQARYTWSQSSTEVILRIPLRKEAKARDVRFQPHRERLDVRLLSSTGEAEPVLVGPLPKKVKADEIFWTVEEDDKKFGRHLFIQMVKADPYEKWTCLIEADGHPQIDTGLVRFYTEGGLM